MRQIPKGPSIYRFVLVTSLLTACGDDAAETIGSGGGSTGETTASSGATTSTASSGAGTTNASSGVVTSSGVGGEGGATTTTTTGGDGGAGGDGNGGNEGDGGAGGSGSGGDGGGASCTASFTGLGDLAGGAVTSVAEAISRDGTTVVGLSSGTDGSEATRWTATTGLVGLGDLAGGPFLSHAYGVSADGSVVAGVSHSALVDCPGRTEEAFRWTEGDGMVGLGDVATGCFASFGYGISSDGETVIGGATNALSNTAATWSTEDESWTDYGFADEDGNSSSISAITPDGAVFVGTDRIDNTAEYQVFRYTEDGGQELLGDLDGGAIYASANDVSDDGSILIGFGTTDDGYEALRWTEDDGLVGLGDLDGGNAESWADAMSPDGSLVVGFGSTDEGQEAAIWDESLTPERLADVLASAGVAIPDGWALTGATGIAVHGSEVSICGNATNADGDPEAWLARYCLP